nr:MAG TPA: hypothetical protein [Caudoviricetes sp.]DAR53385.1 MAG TPA: hypothetical protein [Caudoviricetes sp.]
MAYYLLLYHFINYIISCCKLYVNYFKKLA